MFIKYIKPTGILAEYIQYYWVLEIDTWEGEVWERVIPVGTIQMMFHYKKPFACKSANNLIVQPRSFISGISRDYADVLACGGSGVIAVTFNQIGACNFLDFSLNHIENATVNLCDIDGQQARLVEEQINNASTLGERVAAIENYLLSRFKPVNKYDLQLIKNIIVTILKKKGQITVSDLSKTLSISGKNLERKCSALLGISPKQFIRITRFQEVIRAFSNPGKKILTELSYDNGYFDQAHFIKDFKALSGYTPKEFLAKYPCKNDYAQVV
jgi:AraC-like DNA-binding protein